MAREQLRLETDRSSYPYLISMDRSATITITRAASTNDIEAACALFREYSESLSFSLAFQGFEAELARLPVPYVPPHGSLLVAKGGLDYLGVVGLKRLSVGIAEIKRLYVVLEARRRTSRAMAPMRATEASTAAGWSSMVS
jgi:hypothetical protein